MFDKHHDESEDPGETDRDEDGEIHPHLLPLLLLVRLGGALERVVDFARDEEEDDRIGTHDDKSWEEEAEENGEPGVHVTISSAIPIIFGSSNSKHNKQWNEPSNQMVNLFQRFSITVSPHNHLVEIKCDAEGPNEIGNEEVVENHGTWYAEDTIVHVEGEVEEDLCKENTCTQVDNEFDWVGTHVGEDNKCEDCA
jgi:hypothetical protein